MFYRHYLDAFRELTIKRPVVPKYMLHCKYRNKNNTYDQILFVDIIVKKEILLLLHKGVSLVIAVLRARIKTALTATNNKKES